MLIGLWVWGNSPTFSSSVTELKTCTIRPICFLFMLLYFCCCLSWLLWCELWSSLLLRHTHHQLCYLISSSRVRYFESKSDCRGTFSSLHTSLLTWRVIVLLKKQNQRSFNLFIPVYVYEYFIGMYAFAPCVCLLPTYDRRYSSPWNYI